MRPVIVPIVGRPKHKASVTCRVGVVHADQATVNCQLVLLTLSHPSLRPGRKRPGRPPRSVRRRPAVE